MKYTVLILALLFAACKKDKNQDSKIYFTGIVSRDENGSPVSDDDPTDWQFNDIWKKPEVSLFNQNYASGCTAPAQQVIIAYPNPCHSYLRLNFVKSEDTKIAFRLVDENFKVLFANDSITASAIQLDMASLGIKDTVRLYYKFIENNCEFRGHGDILIE